RADYINASGSPWHSAMLTPNIEHPTSNVEWRGSRQTKEGDDCSGSESAGYFGTRGSRLHVAISTSNPPTPKASAWQALTCRAVAKAKEERPTLNVHTRKETSNLERRTPKANVQRP